MASPFVCKGSTAATSWFVGTRPSCGQPPHTVPYRGSTAGLRPLFHQTIRLFFSLAIQWVRASARNCVGCRSRQARRSACPTRGWVKSLVPPCFTYRSPFCALVFSSFPWYTEFTMEVCLYTLHIMYLTSPAARKSQQKSFRPPSLTFASPCRIVGRPVGCPSIFRSHFSRNTH